MSASLRASCYRDFSAVLMDNAFSAGVLQSLLSTEAIGRCVLHLKSVSSTMDVARQEAESGAPHGLIVVADEQSGGQGRRGRRWVSPPGNLYVTIVLRPTWSVRSLPMIAPLAVCEAAETLSGVRASIKWPNDVLIEGRKVAGILIDVHLAATHVEYALIGIGINVRLDASRHNEIRDIATSLESESGEEISRERLLATLLNRFEKLYAAGHDDDSVYDGWRVRLETFGRRICVQFADHVDDGIAEDVDGDGNLLLRRADGSVIALSAGDVTLTADNP